jgi:hypothetical protein
MNPNTLSDDLRTIFALSLPGTLLAGNRARQADYAASKYA